ncbi:MAG: peptide chain release factor N(5)-glutamine methyltransferase [Clostridia bacterium]|nr:peptide chain release factor N(5)-glutamine methyltransferase [Clostridia bacterium]
MVKIKELRKTALKELGATTNDSPLADIDYILLNLLNFSRTDILLGDKTLDSNQKKLFDEAFAQLKSGKPVQYTTGGCEFMSLWFETSVSTLIPRADTETLVELIIEKYKEAGKINILDIGTGTGCIAISLAHFLPDAKVWGVDISPEAIKTAENNARSLGVSDRSSFSQWDILKGFPLLPAEMDIVVSNPPYIPDADVLYLSEKVKDFEPVSALAGGTDGLDFYRNITDNVKLTRNGCLAFEVGINQAEDVIAIMERRFSQIKTEKDLSGISRVVWGILKD